MDNIRTLEVFVEDMISDGRSLKEIISVAQCSHWIGKKKEITEFFKNFQKNMKKMCKKKR